MKRYKIVAFFVLFAIIQISALNYVRLFDVKPNILLVGVVLLALHKGSGAGLEAGVIAGLLYDLGSAGTFGVSTLSFMLCGYAVGLLGRKVYQENLVLCTLVVFIFSLANNLVYYFISSIFRDMPPFVPSIKHIILPYSFYTTLISPVIFLVLKKPLL